MRLDEIVVGFVLGVLIAAAVLVFASGCNRLVCDCGDGRKFALTAETGGADRVCEILCAPAPNGEKAVAI